LNSPYKTNIDYLQEGKIERGPMVDGSSMRESGGKELMVVAVVGRGRDKVRRHEKLNGRVEVGRLSW